MGPISGVPSTPPGAGKVNASSSGSVSAHLNNPALKNVLKALGLKSASSFTITQQKGIADNMMLRFVDISPEQRALLKAMGLIDVNVVVLLSTENQIESIRKRLSEIKDSMLDKTLRKKLLKSLGIDSDDDSIIYQDEEGGLYVLESFLKEIKKSIENQEE